MALIILIILYIPTIISFIIFLFLKDKKRVFSKYTVDTYLVIITFLLIPVLCVFALGLFLYIIIKNKHRFYYPKICMFGLHDWEHVESKKSFVCLKCHKIKKVKLHKQIERQKIAIEIINKNDKIEEDLLKYGISKY